MSSSSGLSLLGFAFWVLALFPSSFSNCLMFSQFCLILYTDSPTLLAADDLLEILILGLTVASKGCSNRHSPSLDLDFRCLPILQPWHFVTGDPCSLL